MTGESSHAAELAALARDARMLGELDQLFGMGVTPLPLLEPLHVPAPAREAEPAAGAAVSAASGVRAPAREATRPSPQRLPSRPESPQELEARRSRNEQALHELAGRLGGCERCALHRGRTRLVFGQGDAAAELVFVGEGPGANEDQQGLAFVGRSGELLTKMIGAMGLGRDQVFICNVVKCRPPGNRAPAPDEMHTCLPFLREQLEVVRPRVICALGRTAAIGLGLLAPDESLGARRGQFVDWHGIPTLLTFHPAYLLRAPEEKRKAWQDLQRLFPYLERRSTS